MGMPSRFYQLNFGLSDYYRLFELQPQLPFNLKSQNGHKRSTDPPANVVIGLPPFREPRG